MRSALFRIVLLALLTACFGLHSRSASAQALPFDAVSYPISGVNQVPGMGWTALPGTLIEWEMSLTVVGPGIPPGTPFDFTVVPGGASCASGRDCTSVGVNPLRLLCDAPNDPDAGTGGGTIVCDDFMGTNTLTITGTTFPNFGQRVCFRYWTEVDPTSGPVSTGSSGCIAAGGGAGTPIRAPDPNAAGWPWDACGGGNPPASDVAEQCAPVNIVDAPVFDFELLKTADVATAGIGDTITWTLTATDTSSDGADATAYFFDEIEEGMTFGMIVSDDTGACVFDAPASEIQCPDVMIADGEVLVITYTTTVDCPVTISDDDSWDLCNQALICQDPAQLSCLPSDDDGTIAGIPDSTCVGFPMPSFVNSTKTAVWTDVDMDGAVNSGDTVEYTITVVNDGRADATGVIVTDTPDPGCLGVIVPGPDGMFDGTLITWTPAAGIISGGSASFTFTAEITADSGPCDNQAFVTSDERNVCSPPDAPLIPTNTHSFDLGPLANVEATKDFTITTDVNGDGIPDPGDTVQFTIEVMNSGGLAATGLRLTDIVPVCFATCDQGSVAISPPGSGTDMSMGGQPGVYSCVIDVDDIGGAGGLDGGGTEVVTITWDVTVGTSACCNEATLMYDGSTVVVETQDPFNGGPTCMDRGATPATVTLAKSASDDNGGCWAPGDVITFTLDLSSGGGTSTGVTLTDTVGAGLSIVDPGTGSVTGSTVTWNDIASIPSGMNTVQRTYTVMIDCDAADAAVLSNSASVTTDTDDDMTSWSGAVQAPVLSATKTVAYDDANASGELDAGELVTWTIEVTNTGSCAATNVSLQDDLTGEPNIDVTALTVSDGGNDDGAGSVSWDLGTTPALASLDPAATVTVTLSGPFVAGDDDCVDNSILVAADTSCGGTGPAVGGTFAAPQLCAGVTPGAILEVIKTAVGSDSDTCFEPGETVTYTITINNTGAADSQNLVISDDLTLSPDITFVSASDGGTYVAPVISWSGAEVPSMGSIVRTWTGTIDAAAAAGTVIDDTATAEADNAPEASANWSNMVEVAGFDVTKTRVWTANDPAYDLDDDGFPSEGDQVDYSITIDATGCSANGVVVTDVLDPDIKWPAATLTVNNGGVYDEGTWTITWDEAGEIALAEVTVGGPVVLTFTVTIDETGAQGGFDGNVDNTADVTGDWSATPGSASAPRLVIGAVGGTIDLLLNEDQSPADMSTYDLTLNNMAATSCGPGLYALSRLDPAGDLETADVDPTGDIIVRMGTSSADPTGVSGAIVFYELHESCVDITVRKDANNDIVITNR